MPGTSRSRGERPQGRVLVRLAVSIVVLAVVVSLQGLPLATATTVTAPVYAGSISWAQGRAATGAYGNDGFAAIAGYGGRFVAARFGQGVATSDDGLTWSMAPLPGAGTANARPAIAAGASAVAVVEAGAAWRSADLVTWSSATWPTAAGDASPSAVAAVASGFVAVGTTADGRHAAAWMSADGSAWSAVSPQPAFDHFCPSAVTALPSGRVVAVGTDCYPIVAHPAVAISDDAGASWTRAAPQRAFLEEGAWTSVIRGGPGLIAAGTDVRDVAPGTEAAAVFSSADGLTWTRVAYSAAASNLYALRSVLLTAIEGGFLAIGTDPTKPVTLVSPDGTHWTMGAPLPPAPLAEDDDFRVALHAVTSIGGRIVAVGRLDYVYIEPPPHDSTGISWSGTVTPAEPRSGPVTLPPPLPPMPAPPTVPPQPSFPGSVTWAVHALPVSLPPGPDGTLDTRVERVAPWRSGWAVLGYESNGQQDGSRMVVWTSVDGAHWDEHVLPGECGWPGRLASRGTVLLAAGAGGICTSTDAVAWRRVSVLPGTLAGFFDVATTPAGFVLIRTRQTSTSTTNSVWTSTDGIHWRTTSRPYALDGLLPSAVGWGRSGLVVLGSTRTGTAAARTSSGTSWTRGAVQPAFAPWSDPVAITAGGPGYLAVGALRPRSVTGAGAWTSADGLTWKRALFTLGPGYLTTFDAIGRIGPGFAIIGDVAPASQEWPYRLTAWLSIDGTHWRSGAPLAMPPAPYDVSADVVGAAGRGNRLVVAGTAASGGNHPVARAVVWTATYRAP